MEKQLVDIQNSNSYGRKNWFWWPLLPLYPYGYRKTVFKEIVKDQIWSFEQLQGLYYVAVPVRLTVVKVPKGLILLNPLPPTKELLEMLNVLVKKHGPVTSIVLPTASGLEHKISMPALSRAFPKSSIWLCPGQWSFPFSLPLSWLGFPSTRTKTLFSDGLPYEEIFEWISLGPLDIGLGRFQEIACFHKPSGSLIVTDALVGIEAKPPELFSYDPTPLLFHARENGREPLIDSPSQRRKGWKRLVLFASFLKPEKLSIPPISTIIGDSFKPGLRNLKAHYGIFPFTWDKDWELSSKSLVGSDKPLLQVAPVIERLVFPRAKDGFLIWLDKISALRGLKRLVPAHFSAPINFNSQICNQLKRRLYNSKWAPSKGDWTFLGGLDKALLNNGIVPKNPFERFRD